MLNIVFVADVVSGNGASLIDGTICLPEMIVPVSPLVQIFNNC